MLPASVGEDPEELAATITAIRARRFPTNPYELAATIKRMMQSDVMMHHVVILPALYVTVVKEPE